MVSFDHYGQYVEKINKHRPRNQSKNMYISTEIGSISVGGTSGFKRLNTALSPGIFKCNVEMLSQCYYLQQSHFTTIIPINSTDCEGDQQETLRLTCRNAHRHDTVSRHVRPQTVIHGA